MTVSRAPVRRRFPAHPSSVGQARALTREALSEPGQEPVLDDAQLLVSEVVTNALMHAGTPIDLAISMLGHTVRVEVSDGAAHLPVRREYAAMAGTGRGLQLLEELSDQWGVDTEADGKTVWFELTPPGAEVRDAAARPAPAHSVSGDGDDAVTVTLRNVPLLLHSAWHQHAEAVLREYLLVQLDDVDALDAIEAHAAAHEAMALLVESIPAPELGDQPDELLAAATEPFVSQDRVVLSVPRSAVPKFSLLNETLEAAFELAQAGRFLTPPVQPEMRALRQWLCDEVAQQGSGAAATPWSGSIELPSPQTPPASRDTDEIAASRQAVIAADDRNLILAASRPALELLGYSRPEELVGRRILAIIPARYHQAHLAGFSLHLSVGRSPLLERSVTVPAVRRDGSEVLVELTVTARRASGGGRLFVAELKA